MFLEYKNFHNLTYNFHIEQENSKTNVLNLD